VVLVRGQELRAMGLNGMGLNAMGINEVVVYRCLPAHDIR
jgi:hypothetical protein